MRTPEPLPRRYPGFARRDRYVVRAANLVLRLASRDYRDLLGAVVIYGMKAAVRDAKETT